MPIPYIAEKDGWMDG